jgi:transcription-repair coupling factor (superfamily II helicase)
MRLKITATELKIAKIEQFKKKVQIKFIEVEGINFDNILGLKDKTRHKIRYMPDGFEVLTEDIKEGEIITVLIGLVELCEQIEV